MLKALVADVGKCTGCDSCVLVCSFERTGGFSPRARIAVQREIQDGVFFPMAAISYVGEGVGKVERCDLCDGDPMCVGVCTPGALRYGDWEELARAPRAEGAGTSLMSLIAVREV